MGHKEWHCGSWYTEPVLFWTRCSMYICPDMGSSGKELLSTVQLLFKAISFWRCVTVTAFPEGLFHGMNNAVGWIPLLAEPWLRMVTADLETLQNKEPDPHKLPPPHQHHSNQCCLSPCTPRGPQCSLNIMYTNSTYGNNKPVLPMHIPLKNHPPRSLSRLSHCWVKNILYNFVIYFLLNRR